MLFVESGSEEGWEGTDSYRRKNVNHQFKNYTSLVFLQKIVSSFCVVPIHWVNWGTLQKPKNCFC